MVMEMFAGKLHASVIHVDASELFLGHLEGRERPRAKRKIIGGCSSRCSRPRPRRRRAPGPGVAGAGHDLPGRHRIRRRRRARRRHHQEPPQRRRPAEQAGPEAAGAAARPVQDEVRELGVAWACRRDGLPPPVPGPGLGVRILGEVKRNTPTCCAAPTPSSSRSCTTATKPAARAGTT